MPHNRFGFTLVELLVVVTIIVILLALLVPAMDKAIYQTELSLCGANLKGFATGLQTYASGNRRSYPSRGLPQQILRFGQSPHVLSNPVEGTPPDFYDMRPTLAGIIQINKTLNDPLTQPVNLEYDDPAGTYILSSYNMWFDWAYLGVQGGAGMKKLGDRWTFAGKKYSVLVNDYDNYFNGQNRACSHPDDEGLLENNVQDHVVNPFTQSFFTISVWRREGSRIRGPLDLNYAYDDGSVRRLDKLVHNDLERVDVVGLTHNATDTVAAGTRVPRQ